jgi:hypothetical protein
MSRLILGLLSTLIIAVPMAQAQGVSLGASQRTGTTIMGPGSGSYFYPGFGWSSHPLNTGPYYGGYGGYGYGAPVYAAPVAVPGISGFFRFGNANLNYWQAPSGYYYPWASGSAYVPQQPIYIVEKGQTQAQQPPLSSMFTDMESYLDSSQKKGKIGQNEYERLFRRLQDVRGRYDHLRAASDGTLDQGDEESIRRDAAGLGGEISRAVKPLPEKTP